MQPESDRACYEAFRAKDARFDGHFFIGVTSTGIYCRPVCRAKMPRPENCRFFATAAEAEQAGFRPCLQCRPELAPGLAPVDAAQTLAHRAARYLEEHCGTLERLGELAERLGCTERHLRRVFAQQYRVTPVQYLQTCRLLLAKGLLTDTKLSVTEVAMAAGFGSLRRFNDSFATQYRMNPTALRRQTNQGRERCGQGARVTLGYRPPYQWQQLLVFLALRAVPGVEVVRDSTYWRTVQLEGRGRELHRGWVGVEHLPQKNALQLTLSAGLLPVLPGVLARVRHLFDVGYDPQSIARALAPLEEVVGDPFPQGLRLPGCMDAFEMAVRAVLGQQITVKAATTLAGRLVQAFGTPLETGVPGLTHVFPSARAILALGQPIAEKLGPLGILSARSNTIYGLAAALDGGTLALGLDADPALLGQQLLELPGIGPWTAGYIMMRALGWADAFLETDYGVKKALAPRGTKEILALAEAWRPWRGYAMLHLWSKL